MQRRSPPNTLQTMAAPFRTMALSAILLIATILITPKPFTHAIEIVGTNEWQLIGENDTVPAGLHIKMDLSTGKRWARLVQDGDDDGSIQGVAAKMDSSGALSIVDDPAGEADTSSGREETEAFKPERDYEMMHRVMSRLPPEELERFGGLPALPTPKQKNDKEAVLSIRPEDRAEFEAKMEELWTLRQEELRKFQEDNLADIPKVLQERIEVLKSYVSDPKLGREKVLEKRKHQSEDDSSEVDFEGEETVKADDIIECLRDLEYQLSDIDHARDFHTLGGWPYLVALLHEPVHMICDAQSPTDRALMYEVQSLAAMAIGTAIGNLGEFRSWALEDVSSAIDVILKDPTRAVNSEENLNNGCVERYNLNLDATVSALFSLVNSFDITNRSQREIAVEERTARDLFRTYKLRSVYAIGSLLRGNALAQQHFVSKNGPDTLVRYVLGILSSVNGEDGVTKLDYKLASKVLALGEDIVMGVILEEEDYIKNDSDHNTMFVSPNGMVAAFTTEPWCDLSLRMLSSPTELLGESQARSMKERAMSAIRALGPACKAYEANSQCNGSQECAEGGSTWGLTEVLQVKSEWNREGSGDGLDSVYRRELLDLIDSVMQALQ
ncbi:hypothetical protein ACHAXN_002304 [Cyclotella atomus]